jgi:hypothetical protein
MASVRSAALGRLGIIYASHCWLPNQPGLVGTAPDPPHPTPHPTPGMSSSGSAAARRRSRRSGAPAPRRLTRLWLRRPSPTPQHRCKFDITLQGGNSVFAQAPGQLLYAMPYCAQPLPDRPVAALCGPSTLPTPRCGAPANSSGWLDPGWLHHAVIPEVPATGMRVHYRFGSDAAGWSRTFSFAGPPPRGGPTKFLVFNDVGMTQPILFHNVCPPWCPAGLNWAGTSWGAWGWAWA